MLFKLATYSALITTDWLLQYFGQKPAAAKQAFTFFVNSAMGMEEEDPLKAATSTLILGKAEFIDDIREKYLGDKGKNFDIPALKELIKNLPLMGDPMVHLIP